MRIHAIIAALALSAGGAAADTYDLEVARGLAPLEAELSGIDDASPSERAALGTVRFLRGVEKSLQRRYASNAALGGGFIDLPVLRLPFPPNPDPEPFEASLVAKLFEDLAADMDGAREALDGVALGPEEKIGIDLARLWFDIDADGTTSPGEGALDIVGVALTGALAGATGTLPDALPVHFDAADLHWLRAYTHLLSALSELVLAFDPTAVIEEVTSSAAAMSELQGEAPFGATFFPGQQAMADQFAMIYGAVNKVPEQPRVAAAADHLLSLIAENRAFWQAVAKESDDDLEWIPNATQSAALGFRMPPETGTLWLGVLTEAEAVLRGELLVPHWRTQPGGGVNVAKLIADPPEVDIVTWIQGSGLVPYMERGQLASGESLDRFGRLFRGEAVMFMVLLN